MGQTLRPYQTDCVAAIYDAIFEYNRILYTMATGCGKTTTFAEIIRIALEYQQWNVLVLAHRRELIQQAYERIADHCKLDWWEIGKEIADVHATPQNKVIVGSVQTVMSGHRLPDGWKPNLIITDEAHRAGKGSKSYQNIYERFGVYENECIHIGCTATPKRTDRASLFMVKMDGTEAVIFDKKTKERRPVTDEESPFQCLAYEYSMLDAIESGWLVPIHGHSVQTETDISKVGSDSEDFKEGELAKAVDNNQRTLLAIGAWKNIAANRQTLAFCASVEHAHHSAELWRQAGFTAEALDGTSDTDHRADTLKQFRDGKIQVLCNMGLFTEGTDLPIASCIVHLRPTKSWNLYVQMTGRGSRVLPGIIDGINEIAERREAIATSLKPDCIVLDVVDICEGKDLCSVPSIIDLPVKLDLQGESVTEAKKLLDEFEEVSERVIGECPTTYRELKARLTQVNLMRTSGAKTEQDWKAHDTGYRFVRVPPGFQVNLTPIGEARYRLTVSGPQGT